jgi:hypothetical protein
MCICVSFSVSDLYDPEPEEEIGNVLKTMNGGNVLCSWIQEQLYSPLVDKVRMV